MQGSMPSKNSQDATFEDLDQIEIEEILEGMIELDPQFEKWPRKVQDKPKTIHHQSTSPVISEPFI